MHILLIHQAFVTPGQPGGTRHFELAQYLVENGHQVTVIGSQVSYMTGGNTCPGNKGLWRTSTEGGIDIRWVRASARHHKSFIHRSLGFATYSIIALLSACTDIRPDVILGTTPPPLQSLSAFIASKWHRKPFVYEVRDLFWDYVEQTGSVNNGFGLGMARRLERGLYRRAAHLIINSPGFLPHLRQHGISEERITLIPNSVDTNTFSPTAANRRVWEPYGCQDQFIVLYAGAHGMLNNLQTLISAARQLVHEPGICVVLMGDGKEKPALVRQAQDAGATNVLFLDSQPKFRVPEFVASADVCVATLRDLPVLRTVYPNKVFDYLAAGRPVILAIDGVIRSAVEDAQAGIFTPPEDATAMAAAIHRLYSNRHEAEVMGARGRSYVMERFGRREQAARMEALMQRIVDGAGDQNAN